MTNSKYIRIVLRCFAVVVFIYVGYRLLGHDELKKPVQTDSTFNELTVYVSVLESEAKKDHKPLDCYPAIQETFHFKDKWGGLLVCTMKDKHLYIKSPGPDGILGNEDDLVLRRRLL
ncbi:MAG: hypothetical protein H7249_09250 [Chitinophagaceae bacterium]|nr:hypothetical protein [Oligoflexus sp.]